MYIEFCTLTFDAIVNLHNLLYYICLSSLLTVTLPYAAVSCSITIKYSCLVPFIYSYSSVVNIV